MRARRIRGAVLYARSAVRIARRGRRRGREERLVFVVGSPRSGTTITANLLGSVPGRTVGVQFGSGSGGDRE
jgi:hypothetical protein